MLLSSEFVTGDKVVNNENIKGYRTMSNDLVENETRKGMDKYSPVAVTYKGDYTTLNKDRYGISVRPVISISKELLK